MEAVIGDCGIYPQQSQKPWTTRVVKPFDSAFAQLGSDLLEYGQTSFYLDNKSGGILADVELPEMDESESYSLDWLRIRIMTNVPDFYWSGKLQVLSTDFAMYNVFKRGDVWAGGVGVSDGDLRRADSQMLLNDDSDSPMERSQTGQFLDSDFAMKVGNVQEFDDHSVSIMLKPQGLRWTACGEHNPRAPLSFGQVMIRYKPNDALFRTYAGVDHQPTTRVFGWDSKHLKLTVSVQMKVSFYERLYHGIIMNPIYTPTVCALRSAFFMPNGALDAQFFAVVHVGRVVTQDSFQLHIPQGMCLQYGLCPINGEGTWHIEHTTGTLRCRLARSRVDTEFDGAMMEGDLCSIRSAVSREIASEWVVEARHALSALETDVDSRYLQFKSKYSCDMLCLDPAGYENALSLTPELMKILSPLSVRDVLMLSAMPSATEHDYIKQRQFDMDTPLADGGHGFFKAAVRATKAYTVNPQLTVPMRVQTGTVAFVQLETGFLYNEEITRDSMAGGHMPFARFVPLELMDAQATSLRNPIVHITTNHEEKSVDRKQQIKVSRFDDMLATANKKLNYPDADYNFTKMTPFYDCRPSMWQMLSVNGFQDGSCDEEVNPVVEASSI